MAVGGTFARGYIYRKKCHRCKVPFSLLPGFLLPGMSYPRGLVVRRLWADLEGRSYRDRDFLQAHALECSEPGEDQSWSDHLDAEGCVCRPNYALLWSWTRRFEAPAQRAVAPLLCAFMALRLNFERDLAAPLECLSNVQPRACWLAIALGLWRALLEASRSDGRGVDLSEALPSLVDFLLVPSSHGFVRAFSPLPDYPHGSTTGPDPP
jgi:hypothetical protein